MNLRISSKSSYETLNHRRNSLMRKNTFWFKLWLTLKESSKQIEFCSNLPSKTLILQTLSTSLFNNSQEFWSKCNWCPQSIFSNLFVKTIMIDLQQEKLTMSSSVTMLIILMICSLDLTLKKSHKVKLLKT